MCISSSSYRIYHSRSTFTCALFVYFLCFALPSLCLPFLVVVCLLLLLLLVIVVVVIVVCQLAQQHLLAVTAVVVVVAVSFGYWPI